MNWEYARGGERLPETRTAFDALWDWLQWRIWRKVPKRIEWRDARQRMKSHGMSVKVED